MSGRVVVSVPPTAKKGEVIEVRTLASHTMETGFRHTTTGELIPRDIITTLVVLYNGAEIFRAALHPAVSANPLVTFNTVATESGTLEFKWTGDNGYTASATAPIQVV